MDKKVNITYRKLKVKPVIDEKTGKQKLTDEGEPVFEAELNADGKPIIIDEWIDGHREADKPLSSEEMLKFFVADASMWCDISDLQWHLTKGWIQDTKNTNFRTGRARLWYSALPRETKLKAEPVPF